MSSLPFSRISNRL